MYRKYANLATFKITVGGIKGPKVYTNWTGFMITLTWMPGDKFIAGSSLKR